MGAPGVCFPEPGAVVIFYQPPIVCVGECMCVSENEGM